MSGSWAVMSAQISLVGGAFVGGEQLVGIFGDLRGGLADLGAAGEIECRRAWAGSRSSALQISARARLGGGCTDVVAKIAY
jgi:hypothetical protein